MGKVSYDSDNPVSYTEVKVLWLILLQTPDSSKNLSTESCKVMTQDIFKTWMDLPEASIFCSNIYVIIRLLKKYIKGCYCGVISLKQYDMTEESQLINFKEYDYNE